MFKNLIAQAFRGLATRAVDAAEANFGPGKGLAKKRFAINFILARTPLPGFLREILDDILVELVGIAVEDAVNRFNEEVN